MHASRLIPSRLLFWLPLVLLFVIPEATPAQDTDPGLEDLVVIDAGFTPASISVGERVEMHVVVRSNAPQAIRLPEEYPDSQWIEIRSMRMIERGNDREIRVVFSPFRTGTLRMPEIDLGAGRVASQRMRVDSVLPDDGSAQLSPVKPPALLPSFQLLAFAVFVVLISAPFALYRVAIVAAGRAQTMVSRYRANRPYRRVMRRLRELHSRLDELNGKDFYIHLVDELRCYLTARLHPDFMIATAHEMPVLLEGCLSADGYRQALIELFKRADLVKFASQYASAEQRIADLEMLVGVVAHIENRRINRLARRINRPLRRRFMLEAS